VDSPHECRKCGDEVREILHDGCPVSCLGDAPFGYVNVFTSHVKVGFFHGVATPDPAHLLQGAGKFMHHVKLRPERPQTPHRLASTLKTASSEKCPVRPTADVNPRISNSLTSIR
jgi:hypothetical protein